MKTYRFNDEEIYQMLNFAKEYHLEPSKTQKRRTVGGSGGFGDELDRFFIKNLTEIATCKIIEGFSTNKELFPDLEVYTNATVAQKKDADITEILDKKTGERRPPNFKVEVKHTASNEHWFSAREEQIADDLKNNVRGYMVHVSLEFQDNKEKKQRDITGAILKKIVNSNQLFHLNEFSNIEDLEAKIEYAYSYKDLQGQGFYFPSGLIMPESNFPEMKRGAFTKSGNPSTQFELVDEYEGSKTILMKPEHTVIGGQDISLFQDWTIEGKFSIYKKIQTGNEYLYTNEETTMENERLGKYKLAKNKTYKFHLINSLNRRAGKEILKGNNEYSFSRQKLKNLQDNSSDFTVESVCKEIAEGI